MVQDDVLARLLDLLSRGVVLQLAKPRVELSDAGTMDAVCKASLCLEIMEYIA